MTTLVLLQSNHETTMLCRNEQLTIWYTKVHLNQQIIFLFLPFCARISSTIRNDRGDFCNVCIASFKNNWELYECLNWGQFEGNLSTNCVGIVSRRSANQTVYGQYTCNKYIPHKSDSLILIGRSRAAIGTKLILIRKKSI